MPVTLPTEDNLRDAKMAYTTDQAALFAFSNNAIFLATGADESTLGGSIVNAETLLAEKEELEEQRRKEDDPASDASMIAEVAERQRTEINNIINAAHIRSAELGREIANWESQFEEQFGDAWAECIANEVLDPDEIPQRQEGESVEEYRARLESVLVATMIDPNTGEIRPEYADSPYARWAQAQFEKGQVDEFIADVENPNATPEYVEQRTNEFIETSTGSEIYRAAGELEEGSDAQVDVANTVDESFDSERQFASVDAEANAFSL